MAVGGTGYWACEVDFHDLFLPSIADFGQQVPWIGGTLDNWVRAEKLHYVRDLTKFLGQAARASKPEHIPQLNSARGQLVH
jgi:hypothetical protein